MPVRRNVFDLDPNGSRIRTLRAGVREMKSRPASDPTSWRFQANIHGTFDTPALPTWNKCQHGTFFFLSWHRMYICFFERILRAASGAPNLALPYWKWTDQRALPIAFRQPADASNPLFESRRASGINAGALLPLSSVQTGSAMSLTNFSSPRNSGLSFGGQRVTQPVHLTGPHGALENQPHDGIHVLVGGQGSPSQSWMSFPETAARDPIFWLHHSMIDRLWKRWLDQGGGRRNPVNNDAWMDTPFTFFNENGQQVIMRGRDILDTVNQLDYRYDDDLPGSGIRVPFAAGAEAAATRSRDGDERTFLGESGEDGMIEFGKTPNTVSVEVGSETAERVGALAQAEAVPTEGRIVLNIEGVQFDDESPGVIYEVYLNLPRRLEPDFRSDYYVGNVAFFGVGADDPDSGGHGAHPANLSFDVTDIVRALRERGEWNDGDVSVTFVQRGLELPEGEAEGARPIAEQEEPTGRPRAERVTLTTGG